MTWQFITIAKKFKIKIDRRDIKRVSAFRWYAKRFSKNIKFQSAPCLENNFSSRGLGRFILNCEEGFEVALVNSSNQFDYRRENLVILSRQQRQSRVGKRRSTTTSRYKGVSRNKKNKMWRASICRDGKSTYIGEYKSEVEAARAYNLAAREAFGELAFQNEI